MKEIFIKKISDEDFTKLEDTCKGCWINLESPDVMELKEISEKMNIDKEWLRSCIDIDEKSRIEHENGDVLIIIRIPFEEENEITTLPLGIIVKKDMLITISLKPNLIINDIKNGKLKVFTTQKSRFILKILERTNFYFDKYISNLEKKAEKIEDSLMYALSNKEVYDLLLIQKALIYFSSSIVSNETVFSKINAGTVIKLFEKDKELIEDIILSNREINEDVKILREVLSNTLDAYASIVSNNLNIVMKVLTSAGIILSVPVFIASLYGMNVNLPLADSQFAFWVILSFSLFISIALFILFKKKMWI